MPETLLDAALDYLERGWSIIPISTQTKKPLIKWRELQDRQPSEAEVREWFNTWVDPHIALVTGAVSGIVVVDCDNEATYNYACSMEMYSPYQVRTKRGVHMYFAHPRDGRRFGNHQGVHSPGTDWPKMDGLDFRGDGGYVLLPPSKNYSWRLPADVDSQHLAVDLPMWRNWQPSPDVLQEFQTAEQFDFGTMDLAGYEARLADQFVSEWDRTAHYCTQRFPETRKIPSGQGNGRNERVMRFVSEQMLEGFVGEELRQRGRAFMQAFFVEQLPDREFEQTVASMEQAERRNHPERFDEQGRYKAAVERDQKVKQALARRRYIRAADAAELKREAEQRPMLIEPWLPRGTIVQVHGYSGHGKSLFVQHATYALAAARRSFGPFEIIQPGRATYFDLENGKRTLGTRLSEMMNLMGDAGDRFNVWTPFSADEFMNLRTKEGREILSQAIQDTKPDVVVIDTLRTAWPGLEENSAEAWAPINQLALHLRNCGIAVILMHHSNKPGESGLGREAGSTNQLTVLETQIRITQVFDDQETAKNNAGLFDGNYPAPIWPRLKSKLPGHAILRMVMEVRYGKVREWSDEHDRVQWVGFATHGDTDEWMVVSSRSSKQRAVEMALQGLDIRQISQELLRPVSTVRRWLGSDGRVSI